MVWHERSESELVLYFSNIQFNNDWESNSNRFAFHTLIKSKSQKNVLKALRSQSNSGYGAGKFRCQLTVQSLIPPPSQCDCGRRKVVSLGNDHHFLSRKLILKKKNILTESNSRRRLHPPQWIHYDGGSSRHKRSLRLLWRNNNSNQLCFNICTLSHQ